LITRDERDWKQRDVRATQKLLELTPIRLVMSAVAKTEEQFANDNCRHQNVIRVTYASGNGFFASEER